LTPNDNADADECAHAPLAAAQLLLLQQTAHRPMYCHYSMNN
jgi:hypothetical protein